MKLNQMKPAPVIFLGCAIAFSGCRSGNRETQALAVEIENENQEGALVSFDQIYHLYPSPAEMLSIIDMNEMTYDEALLAPASHADAYLDTKTKTYMLGVYMTDLAYSALFGRHESTLDYLDVVRSLSEEIRINNAVDDAMITNARENVEYLDSLYEISNEAFMNILAFCEQNERSNTVVMLSAGAFAESLFLAVNLIDDFATADRLLQHLADQKYTIENFMAFAENVKEDDPNVESTIEDLKRIQMIYDGIQPAKGALSVTQVEVAGEDQPKKLVIGSTAEDSKPGLSRIEFEELKAAVIELRKKIVEG